jgi:hypothetical protein
MFSGIQEILLIMLIILGIIIIPRMMKPRPDPPKIVFQRSSLRLSWTLRLAIVLSILWPAAWAFYFRPWKQDLSSFVALGLGPVVIGWSLKWVLAGMKNKR